MSSSNGRVYNEMGAGEFFVWTTLSPGISPSDWAILCRRIGTLSPEEFSAMVAVVNARKSLKSALKRHMKGLLGMGEGQSRSDESQAKGREMPLVSLGPSGIGGDYQRELQARTVRGHRKLGKDVGWSRGLARE